MVASFTDAWIETDVENLKRHNIIVASFTDAWIETLVAAYLCVLIWSHLLQMRGLKLELLLWGATRCLVASFTDAWIETYPYVWI